MARQSDGRVVVRSRRIIFRLERRLYRFDRWKIPLPGGLPVRALGYAAVCWALAYLASRLPVIGWALGALPIWMQWGTLPGLGVFLLLKTEIDGRAPHRALAAAVRWRFSPRHLAGLRPCPAPGTVLAPLGEVAVRPDWRAAHYRPGRVTGPTRMLLRYPATVAIREGWSTSGDPVEASTLEITQAPGPELRRGKTIVVPEGAEVSFR